jgi:hypothetical protein
MPEQEPTMRRIKVRIHKGQVVDPTNLPQATIYKPLLQ